MRGIALLLMAALLSGCTDTAIRPVGHAVPSQTPDPSVDLGPDIIVPTPFTGWFDYLDHEGKTVKLILKAASSQDTKGLKQARSDDLVWLVAHPPRECYRPMWAAEGDFLYVPVSDIPAAAKALNQMAGDSGYACSFTEQ